MTGGIDRATLSLIGAIYDCVIEPEHWPGTVDAIRRHLSMHNAMLGASAMPNGEPVVHVSCGVPDEYRVINDRYGDQVLPLWGGAQALARRPLEEPYIMSQVTDPAEWRDNAYARNFAAPQRITDCVAVILARDRTMIGHLAFGRHEFAGPIGEREISSLRVLAPHVRRAATITHLLDAAMTKASTFATALDASPSGIVLVDTAMRILHANSRAESMLATGDPIREREGQLSLRLELVPGRLAAAVEAAVNDEVQGRKGMGIPSWWLDGTPSVIHVLPLERRQIRPGLTQRAVAAVFVAEAPAPLQLPADALGLIYSLTPAETRVFELLAEGRTPAEVAAELGSATTTIRTHLQRIFDKTGCHRQAELVGLARTVTLPA